MILDVLYLNIRYKGGSMAIYGTFENSTSDSRDSFGIDGNSRKWNWIRGILAGVEIYFFRNPSNPKTEPKSEEKLSETHSKHRCDFESPFLCF
jgi:hypothetical protein